MSLRNVALATMGGTEQGKNRHNESYGIHRDYSSEAKRLFDSAKRYGIETFYMYDNDWVRGHELYQRHQRVLDEPSFGWAFKPMCIRDALLNGDDYIIWADSNHVLISDPSPMIEIASKDGIFCHEHYGIVYPNYQWTHEDMMHQMNATEKERVAQQVQVNIMCFHNTEEVRLFVSDWLRYALDYEVMIENKMKNHPMFKEHRHEQSIFSILVERNGIPVHPYPINIVGEMMGINKQ